ncbi:chromosome segregation protein SMC [Desulfitobacterium metallireducens]|uniref:Chromosome partition protein Smc n=1 Tax=Desulfitobacterium metallireducens DSM 15288 TaxID=871968 RepID=W0E9R3_9FIRM|nr:chromosome segregation protein SMC [Desulfitobacterium metallireducens]AHF07605.1 chromosome partitioning protein Smc [Desulfitobacterium metallireducens DSM 15288]
MANKASEFPVFLKSVSIQGFKSFADKVKLELGHGLSVVVGPNGSGKSNIADAVRWVLGEQSAKNLRGGKMEDIIFAGSTVRRPVGMAEVSLVFDNSTGIFALDFQEVTITRRVYRDGEGQFFINRAPCRLKDIHELFMDTGAGKEGFSIIGQGRVEEILNLKSEERRNLIEEASGITKYRMRKREALKRLDETEHNLERLEDIVNEIEGQLTPLAEQARVAEQSLALTQEQQKLEIQIVVRDLRDVREKLNFSGAEAEQLRLDLAAAISELGQAESQTVEDKLRLNQFDEKIQNQQEENYKNEQSLNLIIQEQRIRQEREGYLAEQRVRVSKEAEESLAKKHETEERLTALEGKQAVLVRTVAESSRKLQDDELRWADVKSKTGVKEIEELRAEAAQILAEQTHFSQDYQKAEHTLAGLQVQVQRVMEERNIKELEQTRVQEQIEVHAQGLQVLEQQEQNTREELEQNQVKLQAMNEQSQELQGKLREFNREIERMQARHHALQGLEDSREGYQKGVRELLQAKKNKVQACLGLCGTIADLITVEKRYEVAIETALGAGLQNLVAETEKDAKVAVQYLKTHQLGRATFLPLDVIRGGRTTVTREASQDPGFVGIAVDLVQFADRFQPAMESLLGRILVVSDMEAATRVARASGYRARIVTLEGDQVHPGGSLTGGSQQRKGTNLLGRSREIQELSQELELRRIKQTELEKEGQILSHHLREGDEIRKDLTSKGLRLKQELAVGRTNAQNLREQFKRLEKEIETLRDREEVLAQEKKTWTERKQERGQALTEITERVEMSSQAITLQEQKAREASQEAEAIQERLTEAKIQLAKWEQELQQAGERLEHENEAWVELTQMLEQKQAECSSLETAQQTLSQEQMDLETRRVETSELQMKHQEALLLVRKERETLSLRLIEKEQVVQKKRQEQQSVEQKLHALELRTARWETEWETGLNRLQEEFALTWDEVQTYQTELDRAALWARIQELKRQIEKLGPINQAAIEEYPKMLSRHEFLATQKQDLVEANESLHALIGELDITMSERFAEGFKAVNEAFQTVFKELFNGGNAELRLDDPNNLLETGVEIIAQPPGKKPQLLSLLSGGERALTAIGLLFALLRVKPSPFCILDEIEASLDDANVSRFAQYIHRLADSTQFLVISHRKGTMEEADVLYGIAMEESGVSKLLSVQLEEQNTQTA